ncbi:MAG: SMC-Scp complex subunit ScpB [Candidatus Lokiarchaeota archaeon]|nr:SMC-Scp complex subunit ScpB [Candidatus Lokiarchaeota archaeon]
MNNSEEEENQENVEQITPEEKEEEEEELQDDTEDIDVPKEDDDNFDSKESATTVDEIGEPQSIIPKNDGKAKVVEKDNQLEIRDIQKNLIEGALYAAGRPLDVEEIATKLETPKKLTEVLVNELAMEYLERTTALIIAQVGERYQMQLRPEYTESIAKFVKGGAIAERYLRTLTVIALKQPILKSIIIKIRGSGAYEHIKYLMDNDLINAVKKGRSFELTTTDKYSEMFGLPKNMIELKKVMIQQLGVDPSDQISEEPSD